MEEKDIVLEIQHVDKKFPGVHALKDISFHIKRGSVHALVGENGAGKSTLIKLITGAYSLESGVINYYHKGQTLHVKNPLEAKKHGISVAYQDLQVAPELTVAENFFLGKMPRNQFGVVDWKRMYEQAAGILENCDMGYIDPQQKMKRLTVSQQAMVTVAKISNEQSDLIIFDEPTALLPNEDVEKLFRVMKEMKAKGTSIIYISHHLEEVMRICDMVTVLKDGTLVDTLPIEELDEDKMVSMMVGREIEDIYGISHPPLGEEVLRVENLCSGKKFSNISFSLKRGEILGFFGLIGSGRTEIMRSIYGADRFDSGEIYVYGEKVNIRKVKDATSHRIGLVPEDRRAQGLALPLSVTTNINMSNYGPITRMGLVNQKKELERSEGFIKKLRIKAYSGRQVVRNLSGGNQQKVVISKVLCEGGEIIIFDEPTIGVDIGAKKEIYSLMEELVKEGKSILFISSYLPEVMGLSDRIIVMHEGMVSGQITLEEIKTLQSAAEERIMKMASNIERSEAV